MGRLGAKNGPEQVQQGVRQGRKSTQRMRDGLAAIHTDIRTIKARLTPLLGSQMGQLKPRSLAITAQSSAPAWANEVGRMKIH